MFSGQYYASISASMSVFDKNIGSRSSMCQYVMTINRTGSEYGGVAYCLVRSSLQLLGGKVTNNYGGINGGAFQIDTSTLTLTAASLQYNGAGQNGGVVNAINSSISFINSIFQSNGMDVSTGGVAVVSLSSTLNSLNNTYFSSRFFFLTSSLWLLA